jgi:hypothetical protein
VQLLRSSKRGSAKEQIDINSVINETLVLKTGHYRSVIETSSVNFELKSEAEQDALIETYQSFLNGLGCPLQIIVRIREVDLDDYLNNIESTTRLEKSEIYKRQARGYCEFIRSLVSVNRILSRNFYLVVPIDIVSKHDFETAREQLALRIEIVTKGLQRMGMHARLLSGVELLNLFYSFYNPVQAKTQPINEVILNKMHTVFIGAGK